MKIRLLILCLLAGCCFPGKSFAVKMLHHVEPEYAADAGFTITARKRDDGLLAFRIARDPRKAAKHEADSDLTIMRSATLDIYGSTEHFAQCGLAPQQEGEQLIYTFRVSPEAAQHSRFTLSEIDDYKDPAKPGYIGGGDIFEFRLADYSNSAPAK